MNRLARKLWISILIVMICIICAFLWLTSGRSIRVTSAMVQQLIDQAVKVVKQKEVDVIGVFTEEKDYRKYFIYTHFTKMKFGPMYILGTTLGNTTDNAQWDIIKVHAQVGEMYTGKTKVFCCLKYFKIPGPEYIIQPTIYFGAPRFKNKLSIYHYTCLNPKYGVVPDGVALTVNNLTCSEEDVTYRKPDTPLRESETKLALCTKVAYGNRSAELIIEFVEAYRYLGVDKFTSYILEDLNEDAQRVLAYYASIGIMDAYFYEPAAWDEFKRIYHPPSDQSRSDKQLVMFDSFEKLSGYTYFGVIDFDEFLIPQKNKTLKELLADLYYKYTNASGFTFMSKLIDTDWPSYKIVNDLIIAKHITTTKEPPSYITKKNIYKPKYMLVGKLHNHFPKPAHPANPMVKIGSEHAYIRHYRKCKRKPCMGEGQDLVNDTWMAEWSRQIQESVHSVRYRVFGNSSYIS